MDIEKASDFPKLATDCYLGFRYQNLGDELKVPNYLTYINETGNLKVIPLEYKMIPFGETLFPAFYCVFEEDAFILSGVIESRILQHGDEFRRNHFCFTPKEMHFLTNPYFKKEFLQPSDFRKVGTSFVWPLNREYGQPNEFDPIYM